MIMFTVIVALCESKKGPLRLMKQVKPNFLIYVAYVPVYVYNNCCFNFVFSSLCESQK
jgi:hypothetical protein